MAETVHKRNCSPSEKSIVNSIIRWLNSQPNCYVIKTYGTAYSAGQPDLIGCYKGRTLALEVKKPGNTPTKLQLAVLKKWGTAGAITGVVTSVEDVKKLIETREE